MPLEVVITGEKLLTASKIFILIPLPILIGTMEIFPFR